MSELTVTVEDESEDTEPTDPPAVVVVEDSDGGVSDDTIVEVAVESAVTAITVEILASVVADQGERIGRLEGMQEAMANHVVEVEAIATEAIVEAATAEDDAEADEPQEADSGPTTRRQSFRKRWFGVED